MEFPRLLYRGPADATAETCSVPDEDALVVAQAAGWRLRRVADVPVSGTSGTSETDAVSDTSDTADTDADDPETPTWRERVAGKPKPKAKK